MAKHQQFYVYVESKVKSGTLIYHSETNLGEDEAMNTARDLVAKGSRAIIANQYVGSGGKLNGYLVA